MKHILVRYRVKKDKVDEAEKAVHAFIHAVQSEGETSSYEAFREPDGVTFLHFMSFRDDEAERQHREASHTKAFTQALYPLCDEEPVFTELSLIDWTRYAPGS